jgi:hypothetical protein
MKIKTKISFKEYRNLLFGLAYKKPVMKLVLSVDLAMILWILGYYLHFLPVPRPMIYQYITFVLITIVQPCMIYLTIKRNYDSSNHLREQLETEFTENGIKMQGESFYTEIKWEKIFRIEEEAKWFLIYQNNLSAILVPKRDFNKSQESEFRHLLKGIHNVPVRFMKDET